MSAVNEARSASLTVRVGRAFPAAGAPFVTWPTGTWPGGTSGGELLMVVLRCLGCGGGGRVRLMIPSGGSFKIASGTTPQY